MIRNKTEPTFPIKVIYPKKKGCENPKKVVPLSANSCLSSAGKRACRAVWAGRLRCLANRYKPTKLPKALPREGITKEKEMHSLEIFHQLTQNKPLRYKLKMATILLDKEQVFNELNAEMSVTLTREGQPSALFEQVLKELYETSSWYIPNAWKLWDRRWGRLLVRPFFTFDDDTETWGKILSLYRNYSVPRTEEYPNARLFK